MRFECTSFEPNSRIPAQFSFCDFGEPVTMAPNKNPGFTWSELPEGTKSLALICHDSDVPSKGDDVNQDDREVPADLPRVDFFHWVLVDIDPTDSIEEGAHSDGITPKGKGPEDTVNGTRHGLNDYTSWFAGDEEMGGDYFGYDGPAPPWNDSIIHHYHFTLFALDVERAPVDGKFTGQEVRDAIKDHVLDQASVTGTYFLNPRLND